MNPKDRRYTQLSNQRPNVDWVRAATTVAIVAASLLCAAKVFAWIMTGSAAILGSLADNLVDLTGSSAAALAARYAALAPDDNHRFGHHKAEALTALGQVALIGVSATIVAWQSVERLIWPEPLTNSYLALGTMIGSLVVTILLVGVQTYAMRRTGSLIVEGDRAQYLGDIVANLGALAAISVSAFWSMPRADALAGLATTAILISSGYRVARRAVPQLMDEELSDESKALVVDILQRDPDVIGFHALRTRRSGPRCFIQVDIDIDADLSFREAHRIVDRIELSIESAFPDADVIVHADPDGEARLERRHQYAQLDTGDRQRER